MILSFACVWHGQPGTGELVSRDANAIQAKPQTIGDSRRSSIARVIPLDKAIDVEGVIRVDVEVTAGNKETIPVLGRSDFTLLDNGQPQKIVAFQSPADQEPLRIVLLMDTLGLPDGFIAFGREEVTKFLRQNSGHLGHSVTMYSLEDSGFYLVGTASEDGNGFAEDTKLHRRFTPLFGRPVELTLRWPFLGV